jgi:hypothetical protein
MDAIVCPKCGTENPANTMNCRHCRINLQFAIEHPDQIESAKSEVTQREEDSTQKAVSQGATRTLVFALLLLLVCCVVWVFSQFWLTPPQIGPCAPGGAHYDTYLALVQYWSLHLVLGYFVVVARIFVGTLSQNKGTVMFGNFLTIAIVVWIIVAILIWYQIFSRLCV